MGLLIYTKKGCKYCTLAKELLKKKNIKYNEYELNSKDTNYEIARDYLFKTYHNSFPIILLNNNFIGGYTELVKHNM